MPLFPPSPHRLAERLYVSVEKKLQLHLEGVGARLVKLAAVGEEFLRAVLVEWREHARSMDIIRDILMVRWIVLPSFIFIVSSFMLIVYRCLIALFALDLRLEYMLVHFRNVFSLDIRSYSPLPLPPPPPVVHGPHVCLPGAEADHSPAGPGHVEGQGENLRLIFSLR